MIVMASLLAAIALPGCAMYAKCGMAGCPGDAAITRAVQAKLDARPTLGLGHTISVQTWDHVVYLYGVVDTERERLSVESLAADTADVTRVVNLLGVNNGGR